MLCCGAHVCVLKMRAVLCCVCGVVLVCGVCCGGVVVVLWWCGVVVCGVWCVVVCGVTTLNTLRV